MRICQILSSGILKDGLISSLGLTVISMGLYIYNDHRNSTKARLDSRKIEDESHVREVNQLRDRMIEAETVLKFLKEESKETKTILKENYEKLDHKLEKILTSLNKV